MEKHIRRLGWLSKHAPTPEQRRTFWQLYQEAKDADSEYEDIVEELAMMYIRNPAFPGDMIGWLDDDFDYDDQDDEDERKPK